MRTLYGVFEFAWGVLTIAAIVGLVITSDLRFVALTMGANGLSLLYGIAGRLVENES